MAILILAQTDRLQRLLDDLRQLETGHVPSMAMTAKPVLSDWCYASRKVLCLQGVVDAHPLLAEGRAITTSECFAFFQRDDELLVRTLSRWCRVGSPRTTADLSIQ
ncbi:hypothetical protein [Rhizobium leguminosarum]|uniref:hypothetical protein n=1 Tax=Rhizobium leguminosarum TaxID=384 RepID=UPI001441FB79|nr:hypothetical protein [Rhizobium leguminosarum]NKN00585.1 hypothetical protein [Rhizobium leguminosarum bv. viciae]